MAKTMVWLVALLVVVVRAEIPSYIQVCKGNDPKLDTCIINSINNLRENLVQGIPDLSVPSIEPFNLKRVGLLNNPGSNLTDLVITGISKYQILDLKADIEKTRFSCLVLLPVVDFVGRYNIDLKILVATIKGNGKITGKFNDLKVTMLLKARKFNDGGKTYLRFDPIKVTLVFDKSHFQLDNLFNGQRALADGTNDLINDTPEPFLDEIRPSLENALSETFTDIGNKITTHYTYDELFPKS